MNGGQQLNLGIRPRAPAYLSYISGMTGFGHSVAAPGRILVAGDWHGNHHWAVNVIRRIPQVLAGEERPLILTSATSGSGQALTDDAT